MHKFAGTVSVIAASLLLILGTPAISRAGESIVYVPTVPEIDTAASVAALSLIGGAVLIIRGRRKK
jgi:hypothetical protein